MITRGKRSGFAMISISLLACGGAPAKPGANAMSAQPTVSISGEPLPAADDAPPTADSSKTYPIHLHHSERVGDRSHIVIDTVEDADVRLHVATRRKEIGHKHLTKHFHLEGVWTTTALDEDQHETHATIDVTKLTDDDTLLLKGKRIDVTKAAKREDAILEVDGKPVSAKMRKVLEELISLRIDSAGSDDALLGTEQPQHVGGHWSIGGDRARDDLVNNTGVSSTGVSGEATLVGVEHIGGVDVLRIKADVEIDGMVYRANHPGETYDPAQGKMTVTALFPVGGRGAIEGHTSFAVTTRIHAPGPRGISVTGDVDLAAQHDGFATPL